MGGMIIEVRDEMAIQEEEIRVENEGVMCRRVKAGREVWTVVAVYENGDMEQKVEEMREWMERQSEKERVIVGGDFNARRRTEEGGVRGTEEEEEGKRRSKGGKVNGEGRKLIKMLGEIGCGIINGGIQGDEEGEYTYRGKRRNSN